MRPARCCGQMLWSLSAWLSALSCGIVTICEQTSVLTLAKVARQPAGILYAHCYCTAHWRFYPHRCLQDNQMGGDEYIAKMDQQLPEATILLFRRLAHAKVRAWSSLLCCHLLLLRYGGLFIVRPDSNGDSTPLQGPSTARLRASLLLRALRACFAQVDRERKRAAAAAAREKRQQAAKGWFGWIRGGSAQAVCCAVHAEHV